MFPASTPTISEIALTSFIDLSTILSPSSASPLAFDAVEAMEEVLLAISTIECDISSEAVAICVDFAACLDIPSNIESELAFISPLASVTFSAADSTSKRAASPRFS